MSDYDVGELESNPPATAAPSQPEQLKLTAMCSEYAQVEADIERLEALLSRAKERRRDLCERVIPEYMRSIGQDRIGLPAHNADVVLAPFYYANIAKHWPEAEREAAFAALEKAGVGDLVKVEVKFSFGRGEHERAQELVELVRGAVNWAPEPKVDKSVHHASLTSWVRDQTRHGRPIPPEVKATVGSQAELVKRE